MTMKKTFGFSIVLVVLCSMSWMGCGEDATSPPPPPVATTFALHDGGATDDQGRAVATDGAGNTYVTGSFTGSAFFGFTNIFSAGGEDIFVVKYDASGNFLWVNRAGSINDEAGSGIATHGSASIAVVGSFVGNILIGGFNLSSAGGIDIFIAGYDATSNVIWAKSAGGPGDDFGHAVTTDGVGNVIFTGSYEDTASFEGAEIASAGAEDIYIAKYSPTGTLIWVKSAGGLGVDEGQGVTVDGANAVVATGGFSGTAMFDNLPLTAPAGMDAFVAKYNSAGDAVWVRAGNGASTVEGRSVATSGATGDITTTGRFTGSANFGGTVINSAGNSDAFIVQYDGSGVFKWARAAGGTASDEGTGIATDGSGNPIVTGFFAGTANFGGGDLTSAGANDVFVAKYDPSGAPIWSQQAGGKSGDNGYGITVAGSGDIVTTGCFADTASFAGKTLASFGQLDIFTMRTDSDGQIP
jgi:hypothetical protein